MFCLRRTSIFAVWCTVLQTVYCTNRGSNQIQAKRKEAKEATVGLDPFLSKEDLQKKQALRSQWQQARKEGKPKTFWRGCKLFVDGKEVQP